MYKLFLDANIFFAATYSKTGGSRAIFELAKNKKHILVSSLYAIKEAKLNIERKVGVEFLPEFYKLVSLLNQIDKEAHSTDLKIKYQDLIIEKDLPILISSINQKADFLITLDKKDFKTTKLEKANLPTKILLPGEYLQMITS
ncbi:MAG: hypothetical protein AAB373_01585 [Patescibacteria group bacterium]